MLWDHRRSLTRVQPFDGFDRVFRVIDSLDPASTRGFFFDYAFREPGDKKRPGQEWLDRARDFDRGARSLINYCISRGALEAGKPSQAWLNLAKALPDQDAEIKLLVRCVSTADEVDDDVDVNAPLRGKFQEMVGYLDSMTKQAILAKNHLEERIGELPPKMVKRSAVKAALTTRSKNAKNRRTQASVRKRKSPRR